MPACRFHCAVTGLKDPVITPVMHRGYADHTSDTTFEHVPDEATGSVEQAHDLVLDRLRSFLKRVGADRSVEQHSEQAGKPGPLGRAPLEAQDARRRVRAVREPDAPRRELGVLDSDFTRAPCCAADFPADFVRRADFAADLVVRFADADGVCRVADPRFCSASSTGSS